jgi:hypothetical protein
MSQPATSSGMRVAGCAATASSYACQPSEAPSIIQRSRSASMPSAAARATVAVAAVATIAFAPQSSTM